MTVDVTFDTSEFAARLRTGELTRYDGVVRDSAGRLVKHLKEVQKGQNAVEAAASMLTKPVAIAGLALAGVAAASVAVVVVRKQKHARPGSDYAAPTCPTCKHGEAGDLVSPEHRSHLTVVSE